MTDPHTAPQIPGPRTPTAPAASSGQPADTDPPGLTTYAVALKHWKSQQAASGSAPTPNAGETPGPRLLHDHPLPLPPPALPSLSTLQSIAAAAADRARQILNSTPLPQTPLTNAVHIAAAHPGIDVATAYRLDIDVGHWRDLVTAHRTGGCVAVQAVTGNAPGPTNLA